MTALALTPDARLLAPAAVPHHQQLRASAARSRAAIRSGRTGTAAPSSCRRRSTTRGPTSSARRSTSRAASGCSSGDSSALGKAMARVRPVDLSTRLTRTSTYDLDRVRSRASSISSRSAGWTSFLDQEGAAARGRLRVAHRHRRRAAPTCRYGVTFTLSHALTRTTALPAGGRGVRRRPRPTSANGRSGTCAGAAPFRGGPFTLLALGTVVPPPRGQLGAGQSERARRRSRASRRRPSRPTSSSASGTGSSVTPASTTSTSDNLSNGNETQLDQDDLTGALNYAFRLPRSISRARKQVRSSLTLSLRPTATTCLSRATATRLRGHLRRPPAGGPRRRWTPTCCRR